MKIILLAGMLLLTTSLMADYELFTGQTKPVKSVKSEVVFSGNYEDYVSELAKSRKIGAGWGALTGAAAGGLAGAGFGVVFASVLTEMNSDQAFAQVVKVSDGKGNTALRTTIMIGDKNPSYSLQEAQAIMKGAK